MVYAAKIERVFTAEEYLLIERDAPYKSEFWHGKIYAMAGATEPHITINFNLSGMVHTLLRGAECRGFGNDLKVRTTPEGLFAYPDLTIVYGERVYHDAKKDVLLNPTALFEVLSPSTEAKDRGEKFASYRELESLRDYVLVWQKTPRIEHYTRNENNLWIPSIVNGLDSVITLSGLELTLPLAEIYENIIFLPSLTIED